MKEDPKTVRFRKVLGWFILPLAWLPPAIFKFMAWRDGKVSYESFLMTAGMAAMVVFFAAVIPFIEAWRASRPKPPPVYRSTILD